MSQKRISFTLADASHIYEWLAMYWVHDEDGRPYGGCYLCTKLGKRLATMIGKSEVRRIRRVVSKHPCRS